MSIYTDSGSSSHLSASHPHVAAARLRSQRRQVSREAGQAMEKLAHAIEYLCDEAVHHGGTRFIGAPQLDAIQLLISLQRSVYSECPPFLGIWARMRTFLMNCLAAKPAPEMTSTALK
jgi:hypothetical protein